MAGMAPGAASSGAGSLRQGSMPAPSSSYNPSVDLFTMINRQGMPSSIWPGLTLPAHRFLVAGGNTKRVAV